MLNPAAGQRLLLASKLSQPALPGTLVRREALIQRLNEGLSAGRLLTLFSAPAGYGKSTQAAAWAAQVQRRAAWLSLEEPDDDPVRFFAYFLAALQQAGMQPGPELAAAVNAGQLPPTEVLLGELLASLAALRPACLCVLDDFQHIQDPAILHVLQGLLAHAPPRFHLAILTREDPPLPLARLRARGQLTEIRAADLRFAGEEVADFLCGEMGLALSGQELSRLEARTEGWIAGLQLAAIAMQAASARPGGESPADFVASLSGGHRFILGYLTEEVLRAQPPAVQDFLLDTSILSRLSGELCDAVSGRTDSAALLEKLLAANLFLIPLDDEGRWYRYHHLFAELLQNHLRRSRAGQVSGLHLRASRWHQAHNLPAEAIEHALAAGDFGGMVALLETHAWELLNQGYGRRLEAWMQAIPPALQTGSPRASLDIAWMHILRGNFESIPPYLQRAEAALAGLEPTAIATRNLQAELLALQANLMQVQGNLAGSRQAARQALQQASPDNLRVIGLASLGLGGACRQMADFDGAAAALQEAIRASQTTGDPVTEMLAVSHLTLMSIQFGRLRSAAETAGQSIQRLQQAKAAPPPIVGAVYGALGLIYYEWNQVESAREYLLRGIQLGVFSGHNASVIYSKLNLARLLQAAGDLDSAEKLAAEAAGLIALGAPGWVRQDLIARQVSLRLAQGDLPAAEALLRQSGVDAETQVAHQTDLIHLAWLRLLSRQAPAQAVALAQRILASAEAGQRNGTTLQALVLGALIQAETPVSAQDWLARALVLAEPQGYRHIFLDEGAPMAALLRRLPDSAYARHLLALFPALMGESQPARQGAGLSAGRIEPLLEPLTARELEVLRLLAEGLTYAQVAGRLVVSLNTVRFHVKGIYSKLGVEKQLQAVERGRALGLV